MDKQCNMSPVAIWIKAYLYVKLELSPTAQKPVIDFI